MRAYSIGLFPMAESADDPEIFWVEPELRGIIPLDTFHVSKSLAKKIRQNPLEIRVETDLEPDLADDFPKTFGNVETIERDDATRFRPHPEYFRIVGAFGHGEHPACISLEQQVWRYAIAGCERT